jgi:hypothetical protein
MTAFMHNEDVTVSESAPRALTWKRLDGIDLLRGLSIFFVLMNHINIRLLGADVPYTELLPAMFFLSRVFSSPRSLSGAGVHFRRFPCAASIYFGLRVVLDSI